MEPGAGDEQIWPVRAFVYDFLVTHERPPTAAETATSLNIPAEAALAAHRRLHQRHALFLNADEQSIRMAHPFSGIPTDFRVFANGHTYWANCAWDMLGIPCALHVDARIEARFADTREPVGLSIEDGEVHAHDEVVHFQLPFARWYDDLIFT